MSSLSGIGSAQQPAVAQMAAATKMMAAARNVRDSDGDHDGTVAGQVDAKDFGKGIKLDRQA